MEVRRRDLLEFGKRLKAAREEANLIGEDIAKKIGKSKQLISHWEHARSEMMLGDLLTFLSMVDVSADYLIKGIGPPFSAVRSAGAGGRLVPHVAWDDMLEIARRKLHLYDIQARRLVHSECSAQSLQFAVFDRAMQGAFRIDDTTVTVDGAKMPEPGDCVLIALLATEQLLFRRYQASGKGKRVEPPYTLRADNADYEARLVTRADRPVFLGTMCEHTTVGSR